ncbi:uncharacterized protein LOC130731905 [Lotus japonicus]|uniref:uncharacterized protein LOC130731905 n=1 Tax=Lotus japonicus TaxID=34305 RepID=UPI00258EB1B6|nr:uncharacterized protein LOC130731905 [Lotus japonicus]
MIETLNNIVTIVRFFEQHLVATFPNISQADIDGLTASEFPTWFRSYVHDRNNMVVDQLLHHLAWGPKKKVETWPIYFVNGFKFHTEEWTVNKKTINSGVCVEGDDEEDEHYYYGVLKEILRLEYPGEPIKQLVLFNCEWFDSVINRGMKVNKEYDIVEVHRSRRYSKYMTLSYLQQMRFKCTTCLTQNT